GNSSTRTMLPTRISSMAKASRGEIDGSDIQFSSHRLKPEQQFMPERFQFADLRELFAKANEEKSGDRLADIAARSERERVAAKAALADLPLERLAAEPLIPAEQDDVTRLLLETHDHARFAEIRSLT